MPPEYTQFWFRIAFTIILLGLASLPFQEPGSSGFVAGVLAVIIGAVFMAIIVWIVKKSQ